MTITNGKTIGNLVILVLGLAAAVGGFQYGFIGQDKRIAAGFLPVLAGSLMALLAGVELAKSRRTGRSSTLEALVAQAAGIAEHEDPAAPAASSGIPDDDFDIYGRDQKTRKRMLWTVLAVLLATVLVIPLTGFVLAFAMMLVVIAVFVEKRRILPSIAVSTTALGLTYLVFVGLLRVPLPQGILGF